MAEKIIFDVGDFPAVGSTDLGIIPEEQLLVDQEIAKTESGSWIQNTLGGLSIGNLDNMFIAGERYFKGNLNADTLESYDKMSNTARQGLLNMSIPGLILNATKAWVSGEPIDTNWETTLEQLDVTPEQWEAMPLEQRVKDIKKTSVDKRIKLFNPDVNAAEYKVANFAGMVADPLLAVSMAKIPTLAAYGGAEATIYDLGNTGKIDPVNTAIGTVLGGTLGTVIQGGLKVYNKSKAKQLTAAVTNEMNMLAAKSTTNYQLPINLYEQAVKNLGLDLKVLNDTFKINKIKSPVSRDTAIDALEKTSRETVVKKGGQNVITKGLDYIIEPISEGIKRISPRTYGKLKQVERTLFEDSHTYATMVDPFLRKAFRTNALTKTQKDKLWLDMSNANSQKDIDDILNFLGGSGKQGTSLVNDFKLYRRAMDDIHAQRVAAGNTELLKIIGYSPRKIINNKRWYAGAKANEVSAINKILKETYKISDPKEASEATLEKAISKYLKGTKTKNTQQAGSAKPRQKEKLTAKQLNAYQQPWNATHRYIKESMEEVQRYKVFGTKNIDVDGDIDKTIANYIAKELKAGKISGNDVDSLKEYLTARFINGPKQMNEHLRKAKDLGYMTLLGHPSNAIRQFGDLAAAAYVNGIKNTMKGVISTLNRGKMLTPKEMGLLDNVAEEFASDTATKRGVDAVFKYSGFRSVDALGKGALVNSSIYKAGQQVKSPKGTAKFLDEWSSILGAQDAAKAVDEFKAFNKGTIDTPTPLMKDIAFMQLSKIQPVTLSEMPRGYLNNPNGRMMYMLQSFAMKHVNVIRQDALKDLAINPFNKETTSVFSGKGIKQRTKALKNLGKLMAFYTTANVGADKIIDMVLNKDTKAEDTWWANFYRSTGFLSKYDVDQMARGGEIYEWATAIPVPPLDPVAKGVVEATQIANNLGRGRRWDSDIKEAGKDMWQNVPIIGRLMANWLY